MLILVVAENRNPDIQIRTQCNIFACKKFVILSIEKKSL